MFHEICLQEIKSLQWWAVSVFLLPFSSPSLSLSPSFTHSPPSVLMTLSLCFLFTYLPLSVFIFLSLSLSTSSTFSPFFAPATVLPLVCLLNVAAMLRIMRDCARKHPEVSLCILLLQYLLYSFFAFL